LVPSFCAQPSAPATMFQTADDDTVPRDANTDVVMTESTSTQIATVPMTPAEEIADSKRRLALSETQRQLAETYSNAVFSSPAVRIARR